MTPTGRTPSEPVSPLEHAKGAPEGLLRWPVDHVEFDYEALERRILSLMADTPPRRLTPPDKGWPTPKQALNYPPR